MTSMHFEWKKSIGKKEGQNHDLGPIKPIDPGLLDNKVINPYQPVYNGDNLTFLCNYRVQFEFSL